MKILTLKADGFGALRGEFRFEHDLRSRVIW